MTAEWEHLLVVVLEALGVVVAVVVVVDGDGDGEREIAACERR